MFTTTIASCFMIEWRFDYFHTQSLLLAFSTRFIAYLKSERPDVPNLRSNTNSSSVYSLNFMFYLSLSFISISFFSIVARARSSFVTSSTRYICSFTGKRFFRTEPLYKDEIFVHTLSLYLS